MNFKYISRAILFFTFVALAGNLTAQDNELKLKIVPEKSDWTYKLNQPAKFIISAQIGNHAAAEQVINYKCGPEFMPPTVEKEISISNGDLKIEAGTMKEPGFLRCVVSAKANGKNYRALATAGYEPEAIKPTTDDPADFDKFWNDGKAELAKIPLDAKFEPLPGYGTPEVDVFQVNFQNVGRNPSVPSRIYGILAVPKAANPSQKFPAVLGVPGAGVRPYKGLVELAKRGIITLQIGIHGIPVTLDEEIYNNLAVGALNRYMYDGFDNKNDYYYRRVFLGAIRANDFLASLPQFDGKNLAVMGGSQGGALSIATAALDPRVKAQAVWIPALADLTGYLYNRAGGWHHALKQEANRTPQKIETSKYYDTVNFARRLKTPGFYTFGYNDEICPPTSMYAAYNIITAPKKLLLEVETGHGLNQKQTKEINDWIESQLKN